MMPKAGWVADSAMKVSRLLEDQYTHIVKRAYKLEFNLLDKTQLVRHPHKSFFVYLGPQARESAVSAAFRLCQRKRVRKDRSQVMECARCKHGTLIPEFYERKILY